MLKKDGTIKKAKIYDSWGRQLAALQATSRELRIACRLSSQLMSTILSGFNTGLKLELDKHYECLNLPLISPG